jgi:threonine aldolase
LAGVSVALLDGDRCVFTGEQVREAVRDSGPHSPRSRLVSIENTTNHGTGKVWSLDQINDVADVADEFGLKKHMDGARLMNAVVASGIPATQIAARMDTVWVDLSKGLGCPVGAVLAGSREDMHWARRYKHLYGGAMRQAGIIAAAGVFAFRHNIERLAEDHANAKLLAQGLSDIPGIDVDVDGIETNIVHFDIAETGRGGGEFNDAITARGARMGGYGTATRVRAVTHLDVSRADIERTVEIVRDVVVNA